MTLRTVFRTLVLLLPCGHIRLFFHWLRARTTTRLVLDTNYTREVCRSFFQRAISKVCYVLPPFLVARPKVSQLAYRHDVGPRHALLVILRQRAEVDAVRVAPEVLSRFAVAHGAVGGPDVRSRGDVDEVHRCLLNNRSKNITAGRKTQAQREGRREGRREGGGEGGREGGSLSGVGGQSRAY